MGFIAWAILDVVAALILHWPTWLALGAAQALSLWATDELRWLPSYLFGIGFLWALVWPMVQR